MDNNPESGPSGWTFFKVIGVILGVLGMVGFGLCTLCGVVIGLNDDFGDFWVWVLAGAVMTGLSFWLVRTIVDKVREAREAANRNDP